MTTNELNRPAPRPLYSILDCSKLARDTGFTPQGWRDALKTYLSLRS
jgi:dTDP-4-dehydrorhamnose reductase